MRILKFSTNFLPFWNSATIFYPCTCHTSPNICFTKKGEPLWYNLLKFQMSLFNSIFVSLHFSAQLIIIPQSTLLWGAIVWQKTKINEWNLRVKWQSEPRKQPRGTCYGLTCLRDTKRHDVTLKCCLTFIFHFFVSLLRWYMSLSL